jgi:acetyltransferase-like isoleucine patch superfamily enzyme
MRNLIEKMLIVFWSPFNMILVISSKFIQYHHLSFFLSAIPFRIGMGIRRQFYIKTLKSVGKNFNIYYGAIISNRDVVIGNNVRIGPYNTIGHCTFGNDVILAQNVHILSGRHQHAIDKLNIPINQQKGSLETVNIGNDVWIGAGSIIMNNIGSSSIVGAGSVVVKPVQDNIVVAGNPAKTIKQR